MHDAQPTSSTPAVAPPPAAVADADGERRFGALRRLYGGAGYARLRAARVAVVGLGGVGSWAVEALARSGVAELTLVDFDQVAESNINRQVQALGGTVGMAKVDALAARIADIHPGCRVHRVEAFAAADNWPGLLPRPVDAVIDACDQSSAKLALAAWALGLPLPPPRPQLPLASTADAATAATVATASRAPAAIDQASPSANPLGEGRGLGGAPPARLLVCVGAAGGKLRPQAVECADLADATHDPLLAGLRQRLRRQGAPRQGRIGLACVFSREPVAAPLDEAAQACATDGSLNCHGYGSSVAVTATFGLVAAAEVLRRLATDTSRGGA